MKLIITVLFASICHCLFGQVNQTLNLHGRIDTIPFAKYLIAYKINGQKITDSIQLDQNSSFNYGLTISEPTRISISIENIYNPKLVKTLIIYSFWVEPGKEVFFHGKTGWLVNSSHGLIPDDKRYSIQYSNIDSIDRNFNKTRIEIFRKWESEHKQTIPNSIEVQLYDSLHRHYLDNRENDYYKLYLMNNKIISKKYDRNYMFGLLRQFPDSLLNTYLAKEIENRLKAFTGNLMPDFEFPDTHNNPIKLSVFRGKYVLVDFWASWCKPCRREMPFLKTIYNRFHKEGLEIVGVSFDQKREKWLQAIKEDGTPWVHVLDSENFEGEIAKKLFITGIPTVFLLDPDGIIVGDNLRGEALERKLESIFQKK